jgi:hypothetical protein
MIDNSIFLFKIHESDGSTRWCCAQKLHWTACIGAARVFHQSIECVHNSAQRIHMFEGNRIDRDTVLTAAVLTQLGVLICCCLLQASGHSSATSARKPLRGERA